MSRRSAVAISASLILMHTVRPRPASIQTRASVIVASERSSYTPRRRALRSASSIGAFVCAWVEYNALNCYMQHADHRGGGLHLAC